MPERSGSSGNFSQDELYERRINNEKISIIDIKEQREYHDIKIARYHELLGYSHYIIEPKMMYEISKAYYSKRIVLP